MDVRQLQQWLNDHGASPRLVVDGQGGALTRAAIINVFVNKLAIPIIPAEVLAIATRLGDTNDRRIRAVASVEAKGSGWFTSGLPKILYERHYFYRLTRGKFGITWYSNSKAGDYTQDKNDNDVIDSWEKLAYAACKDPDAAFQSISIGKFQVMGVHYKLLGYNHPIEMLWAARNSELAHYEMLAGYIKAFGLQMAFLKLSSLAKDCIPFASGYNGQNYAKYEYHLELAKALKY